MKIEIYDTPAELGKAAGKYAAGLLREAIKTNGSANIILATGTSHTVREFVERAFVLIGRRLEWKGEGIYEAGVDAVSGKELVKVDPSYFRPTEVDVLVGDASKARAKLGWQHRVNFDDLVKEMVEEDRRALRGCAEEMNAANY